MWTYHHSYFISESDYNDLLTPWGGHKFFGYDLVANTNPQQIVELGTEKGTSLFTFEQAIKDLNLECKLIGIDTQEGDLNTGPYEGDKIYEGVQRILTLHFPEVKIRLIRDLFDHCLEQFDNHSIDILHIDGLHTYEAVQHDYETWKTKLSPHGVVLFHDTTVEKEHFGVNRFWAEVSAEFPQNLSFPFSNGLGVEFKSMETPCPQPDEAEKNYLLKTISAFNMLY